MRHVWSPVASFLCLAWILAATPPSKAAETTPEAPLLELDSVMVGAIDDTHPVVETEALRRYQVSARGQSHRIADLEPGKYFLELRSYFFDAYLVLRDLDGRVLAEDDDGLLRTHARIAFEVEEPGSRYLVEACALHEEVGEYELRITRGTPEAQRGSALRAAELADAQKELEVVGAALGEQHPSYARSLEQLGRLYYARQSFEEAEPLYARALDIRKETLGDRHPLYAQSLNALGLLYHRMGDFEKAEPLYLEALDVRGEVLGETDPDYAATLNNLAGLYFRVGWYDRAEPLYLQARDIRLEVLGDSHPDYATSLNNLAGLYEAMGLYQKAEPLYLEAQRIRAETLGEDDPRFAVSLNNLAGLYESMGAYPKAEQLYLQSRELIQKTLGTQHPRYGLSLNNLAVLYKMMGAYERAEPLYLEARELFQKTVGTRHPGYASSLNNLAALYEATGDYEKAEPLYLEVLEIQREAVGEHHTHYAASLSNLAELYESMERYEEAESLFLEAREIQQAIVGSDHPLYARSLGNLAGLHKRRGEFELSIPLYREAIDITQASLEQAALVLTEERQLAMASSRRSYLHEYLDAATHVPGAAVDAFDLELNWKGSVLVRQRRYRQVASQPEMASLFERLQRVSRALASTARRLPESQGVDAWRAELVDLENEKERLVRDMSAQSEAFRAAHQRVSVEEILEALPERSVLVDYVVLHLDAGQDVARRRLVAFVAGDGAVSLSDLGDVEPIEDAIETWRAGNYGLSEWARGAASTLRARLWEPLLSVIGNADVVLVSPDGALGLLPLHALPGRSPGTYLLEEHRIALTPVPRLLSTLDDDFDTGIPETGLLAMGGVDYDSDPDAPADSSPRQSVGHRRAVDLELRGGTFSNAISTNTLAEIALIQKIFSNNFDDPIVTLEDVTATEQRFREIAPGSFYIHVATHGFFAPPEVRVSGAGRDALALDRDWTHPVPGLSPYLLSGLAFAGANLPPRPGQDDGILTAEEIAFLPLENAELVCLSACETGLGEVAGGEGLLGLQRAFQISGARSTIASLWKVPDLATRLIMERFYVNLWKDGMSKLDALREAQLWMLRNPDEVRGVLLTVDSESNPLPQDRTPPVLWAAFQVSGDWR